MQAYVSTSIARGFLVRRVIGMRRRFEQFRLAASGVENANRYLAAAKRYGCNHDPGLSGRDGRCRSATTVCLVKHAVRIDRRQWRRGGYHELSTDFS